MKKQRHIGVYGLVIKDNKILLITKAKGAYKGLLDLPGGGIEHGETPEVTISREILEETGLESKEYSLFDVNSVLVKWNYDTNNHIDLHHIGIFYKVKTKEGNLKTTPDGLDSLGASWHEIDKLDKKELSPFTVMMLEKLGYMK